MIVPNVVHYPAKVENDQTATAENPAGVLPNSSGSRTSARVAKGSRRTRPTYNRLGPDAGTVALACRHALVSPNGARTMSKRHIGSSLDDFLKDEGIFDEAQAQAVKEVVAWQLAEAMKARSLTKARMAALLKTSRSQLDRLLDPKNDVTLSSLQRAAAIVGRKLRIELV